MNQIVLQHSLGLETALALHIGGIFKYSLEDFSNLKLAVAKHVCDLLLASNISIAERFLLDLTESVSESTIS